jgi:hypothetical protein
MDEESIVRLAQEAGIYYREIEDEFCEADKDGVPIKMMAKFAALVAAAERDSILKMSAENWYKTQADYDAAIRARGSK